MEPHRKSEKCNEIKGTQNNEAWIYVGIIKRHGIWELACMPCACENATAPTPISPCDDRNTPWQTHFLFVFSLFFISLNLNHLWITTLKIWPSFPLSFENYEWVVQRSNVESKPKEYWNHHFLLTIHQTLCGQHVCFALYFLFWRGIAFNL